ncbi:MAG: hypothetical protein U9N08_03615 [Candidatus Caldatribacteriota bacterium]|nr:hypothetical protein [Candidatus Caldatribacteriota bacterium]
MRVALIYNGENRKLDLFIKELFSVFKINGDELKVFKAERNSTANYFSSYDFILTGCPVISFFRGKLPSELTDYIQKCSGLERKKSIVFIIPRLIGNDKTLKNLMSLLEKKGSFVIDFLQIKDPDKDSKLLISHLK